MDRVQAARTFAMAAHASQRYGEHPYVWHLDAVATIVAPFGETAQVIAYLHDTVEDTATTLADVHKTFGAEVARCVQLLTDEPGATRSIRKAMTYDKLACVDKESELALVVTAADRLANVRACIEDGKDSLKAMYANEHPVFRVSVRRARLCDAIWAELDELLTKSSEDRNPRPTRL